MTKTKISTTDEIILETNVELQSEELTKDNMVTGYVGSNSGNKDIYYENQIIITNSPADSFKANLNIVTMKKKEFYYTLNKKR